jgi:TonB family protein
MRTQTAGPPVSPAVVTAKPTPVYTDEARRLRIEGEVVMEVMFPKTGKPQVLRILERLGHGLDESAITAVTKIEFTPAYQLGSPVDSKAVVRVVFKLA